MKIITAVIICLFGLQPNFSQSLLDFKWEYRLVVVFTDSDDSEKFAAQKNELISQIQGFEDRKLKLIHAVPGKYRQSLPVNSEWIADEELYSQMLDKESDFEVILIGLDGGVKLRQKDILEPLQLFSLIDSMPMRQAEMRRKND